jgi:peptidoglycan/LPS O-acetylase OafA/YrhL
MKRILWVVPVLVLVALPLFAQDTTAPPVTLPVPEKVVGVIAAVFAVGGTMYKVIDGLKNIIPGVKDRPLILKGVNFAGAFLVLGGACMAAGGGHDAVALGKCLVEAVAAGLIAAGFHEAKKTSDLARASATVPEFKTEAEKK